MITSLDDHYFQYLYDFVGLPKRGHGKTFWKLLRQIHAKQFTWTLEHDNSRCEDAKELRWMFVRDSGLPKVEAAWLYRPCTLLEVIVGIARRMRELTEEDHRMWFSQLLHNLDLDIYNDMNFDGYILDVDRKIETLIQRKYQSNGLGGLFPLHNPPNDQRGVDIWYQMNAWLIERNRREG